MSSYSQLCEYYGFNKCIVTGQHIHYPNTRLVFSKDGNVVFHGSSPMSKKLVNDKEYSICVGYEGMLLTFGDSYAEKNLSKQFNTLNEYSRFAFQIDDTDFTTAKETGFGAGVSLSTLIKRHGETEGNKKWDLYKAKQAHTNTFDYKQLKHGWGQDEFDSYNRSRAVTLGNLVKKHGEAKGILKYESYCDRQRETSTIEYLTSKFGDERTREILDARGRRISYFEKKFGNTAIDEFTKYKDSLRSTLYFSKVSIEFFETIIALNELTQYEMYYADNEYGIMYTDDLGNHSYYRYDFTIPSLKLIIEFNGDNWHANPKIYENDATPNPFNLNLTASDIWEHDKKKRLAAESRGFTMFYVWESEYKTNPSELYINVTNWIAKCKQNTSLKT